MKLNIPAKAKSKETLYCVIREKDLIIVYKNNTGLFYNFKPGEKEELEGLEGVWHQTKSGHYKLCTKDLSLWSGENLTHLPSNEFEKTQTEVLDDANVPAKLRYKQPFKQQNYGGIKLITFHKYSHYTFVSGCPFKSVLEVFTDSKLNKGIEVLDARIPESLNIFKNFMETSGLVTAVDTETYDPDEPNGWQALVGWMCNIRMLQVYSPHLQKVIIVDFGMRGHNVSEKVRFLYGAILQENTHKKEVIFQNALFDLLVLEFQLNCTFYFAKIRDTMLMSKQVWAGIGQISHGLGDICNRLGVGNPDKSLQRSDFGQPLIPGQFNYGADDTILTYDAKVALEPKLKEAGGNYKFARIDNAYVNVCHMIRRHGIYIDQKALHEIAEKTRKYYEGKADAWFSITGLSDTASSKALVEYLHTQGVEAKNAQKGTIKALVNVHPPLQHLLDAKVAKKRLDYLKGVKINLSYKGTGCATPGIKVSAQQGIGRTSQGDLVRGTNVAQNFQNPSRENREYPELPDYRPIFAAPPGYKFISIDLSGSHGRLAIHYAKCAGAMFALQPGNDLHSYNASFIAGAAEPPTSPYYAPLKAYSSLLTLRGLDDKVPIIPPKLETWLESVISKYEAYVEFTITDVLKDLKKAAKHYRNIAKTSFYTAINFGGAKRLQAALKGEGIILTEKECKAIMDALWEAIPEIRQYVKAKQKETNRMRGWKPEELNLLSHEDIDWSSLTEEEAKEMRRRPVDFGHLVTDCGFSRYVPRYYQTGWRGQSYVSASITDVAATCWMSAEAKVIKMTQIRILHEYILPNNYHLIDPSTGFPKVWIMLNCH